MKCDGLKNELWNVKFGLLSVSKYELWLMNCQVWKCKVRAIAYKMLDILGTTCKRWCAKWELKCIIWNMKYVLGNVTCGVALWCV